MATELKEEDINVVYFDVGNHLDDLRKACIESWHKFLPKANFICITEEDPELKEYLENNVWAKACMEQKMTRYAIDVFRLILAEKYDNYLYLDTDVFIKQSPLELLNKNDEICGIEIIDNAQVPQNGTVFWLRHKTDKFKELVDKYNTKLKFDFENTNGVVNKDSSYLFNLIDVKDYFYHVHFGYFLDILCLGVDEIIVVNEKIYKAFIKTNKKNENWKKIWLVSYKESIEDRADRIEWIGRVISVEDIALPYIINFYKKHLKVTDFKDLDIETKKRIIGI